jgi:hypothetical protein
MNISLIQKQNKLLIENILMYSGHVRILIKTRLKIKFDIFSIVNLSKFTFNRVLISIRTRPHYLINIYSVTLKDFGFQKFTKKPTANRRFSFSSMD